VATTTATIATTTPIGGATTVTAMTIAQATARATNTVADVVDGDVDR